MSAPVLLIDNYDSFVYNLSRYVEELDCRTVVIRNDELTIADIRQLAPAAIILSPGPCTPHEAGICVDVVSQLGATVPMLGVCLGHQAIAVALGGKVVRSAPVHGRTSMIWHSREGLFDGLPNPLSVARYHSLVVAAESLPASLTVTARTAEGIVMALQHQTWRLWGVQFHPESILTGCGHRMLASFLKFAGVGGKSLASSELMAGATEDDFYARSIQRDHPPPRVPGIR